MISKINDFYERLAILISMIEDVDYTAIRALASVVAQQSFDRAAKQLNITQSAVSQRIAGMEAYYGQKLIIREHPYHLTPFGERLVGLLKQVSILQSDLSEWIAGFEKSAPIRVAVNRDSLDLWFLKVLHDPRLNGVLLEVSTLDEHMTLDFLKKGMVDIAVSAEEKSLPRCEAEYLGSMKYRMVANLEFKQRCFGKKVTKKALQHAPAVRFDTNDQLHELFLKKFYRFDEPFPYALWPSVTSFKAAIILGQGYGLVPELDILTELKRRQVIELAHGQTWKSALYLHSWSIQSQRIRLVKDIIKKVAAEMLPN